MRWLLVVCLAFAGVLLLAGAGWALVAGAVLVAVAWRREPDWAAFGRRARLAARRVAARVRTAPRRVTALGGMTGGIALVPAGLALSAGAGVALAAGGFLLIGLGLLTGWGA